MEAYPSPGVRERALLAENLTRVRERIAAAAHRSGRQPGTVRLVVVTKTQPAWRIRAAVEAGAAEIGENYVQEAAAKLPELGLPPPTLHLIGRLQRNKAGRAAALFDMVQSVDALPTAAALDRAAARLGRQVDVLIEVNLSGLPGRCGVAEPEALALAEQVAALPALRLRGLMGMGPLGGSEEETRRCFRRLATLFGTLPDAHRQVLSMGMTADFEAAVEEGSTMVRVGTAIFGPRPARAERSGWEEL